MLSAGMKRYLPIILGGLAMFAVAVFCAFLALRIAIHGREVVVPNLSGKSDGDAASAAKSLGLNLSVENRFYSSAVAPNVVLSQSPAPGSRVRRGWQVRVTESLGTQKVAVPDITGQTERPATLVLRRLQLEPGTIAHLPAAGPAGIVLAQSPPPNTSGLNGPHVALLVSDEETSADAPGFIMPALANMTLANASNKLASAGLHIASVSQPQPPPEPAVDPLNPSATPVTPVVPTPDPVATAQAYSVEPTVIGQTPAPGHRVTRADAIRLTMSH